MHMQQFLVRFVQVPRSGSRGSRLMSSSAGASAASASTNSTSNRNRNRRFSYPKISRLGIVADVQYADAPDGADFAGKEIRRYRNSLRITRDRLVKKYFEKNKVDAVMQLGDAIDGRAKDHGDQMLQMKAVLDGVKCKGLPRFDVLGNHELYHRIRARRCEKEEEKKILEEECESSRLLVCSAIQNITSRVIQLVFPPPSPPQGSSLRPQNPSLESGRLSTIWSHNTSMSRGVFS